MSEVICVRNYSSGLSEFRTLVFKKGMTYQVEYGRFAHKITDCTGNVRPISTELLESHFMTRQDFDVLKEVEYIINEVGELMDDLESDRITAKEFKELFVSCKGQQITRALSNSRKYIRG